MQIICIRNTSEISHFLIVIEFNTKFEEKHVGMQEPSTRYFNAVDIQKCLTSLQGTRYGEFFPSICLTKGIIMHKSD